MRATRRFKELQERGENPDYDTILKDVKARDERDSNRAAAPLKAADDATILDTSDMNAEEAYQHALDMMVP